MAYSKKGRAARGRRIFLPGNAETYDFGNFFYNNFIFPIVKKIKLSVFSTGGLGKERTSH
jgi:hypothetical protein